MTDTLTKERRSWNMSRIRSKNTKPELIVRSLLHRMGYRFTVNGPLNRKLPGKPDIVLPKYKTVIFVHGCFWHRHKGCPRATTPKSKTAFWLKKFSSNIRRDKHNRQALKKLGWHFFIIWECLAIQFPEKIAGKLEKLLCRKCKYIIPSASHLLKVAESKADYNKST